MHINDLGLIDYNLAWEQMQDAIGKRCSKEPDEIWFAEHTPVYTLGHAASEAFILSNNDVPVVRTDRGGQVTYHGPGQLMIYTLLNLKRLGWGPKRLICELETLIIKLLEKYEIFAERREGAPGIYVQDKKIASIGLKIKKGFCYHGISLNIDMDLKPFDGIITCGIEELDVTQITDYSKISIELVKKDFINILNGSNLRTA